MLLVLLPIQRSSLSLDHGASLLLCERVVKTDEVPALQNGVGRKAGPRVDGLTR